MKKTTLNLASIMFAFSMQGTVAAKNVGVMPTINSLLFSEEVSISPSPSTFDDIYSLLVNDCSSCHDNVNRNFRVYRDNIDDSWGSAILHVDSTNSELSSLLRKPALLVSHNGGKIPLYGEGETRYKLILKWINDGALR